MPLFKIANIGLERVATRNFEKERTLQSLIEKNLGVVFGCRLVASEFSTGSLHSGRIDTLALSEDNNPVILEYKKVQSSELINQSLFYLAWLRDHRGDFKLAVMKALGEVEVDWSAVRVICIAPDYRRYDLHAVQVMGTSIELWKYRLFENQTILLEEVFRKTVASDPADPQSEKDPKMVAAGKKAAETRATQTFTVEEHFEGKPEHIQELARALGEFIMSLDPSIEEAPKKTYIAYKAAQNIACMEMQLTKILLFLKLDPEQHPGPEGISRDVAAIGHFGTGDLEVTLQTESDLEAAKPFIALAYENVGG